MWFSDCLWVYFSCIFRVTNNGNSNEIQKSALKSTNPYWNLESSLKSEIQGISSGFQNLVRWDVLWQTPRASADPEDKLHRYCIACIQITLLYKNWNVLVMCAQTPYGRIENGSWHKPSQVKNDNLVLVCVGPLCCWRNSQYKACRVSTLELKLKQIS